MPWLQLRIQTHAESAPLLNALLNLLGAVAVTLQDAADQPIYEPAPETTPLWAQTQVIALFPEKTDLAKIMPFLTEQVGAAKIIRHSIELIEEQNWERAWLEHFHPMQFGKRLWICPSVQAPPDPNAVNIILDPGLAFGTGTHPTTALCLEWLDGQDMQDKIVIDYGCGSGILAIAALKLGAHEVWAIDYDSQALEATLDNASRNQIDSKKLHVLAPDKLSTIKADVILANILANPLIELAPRFAELLNTDGKIVLSGILANQLQGVLAAYQPWFKLLPHTQREEWVRLEGIRNK